MRFYLITNGSSCNSLFLLSPVICHFQFKDPVCLVYKVRDTRKKQSNFFSVCLSVCREGNTCPLSTMLTVHLRVFFSHSIPTPLWPKPLPLRRVVKLKVCVLECTFYRVIWEANKFGQLNKRLPLLFFFFCPANDNGSRQRPKEAGARSAMHQPDKENDSKED